MSLLVIGIAGTAWYAWQQLTAEPAEEHVIEDKALRSGTPSLTCPEPGAVPAAAGDVEVRVLNGTRRNGLAASVTADLRERGYITGEPTNTTASEEGVTIVHGPQGYLAASSVAAQFPEATLRLDAQRDGTAVEVLLGSTSVELVAADQAAERLAAPVAAPEGCD
ncbi:LytR C-terminal domain-containing protein [Brachybacterium sp. EF45031]|nr:LytR C-terminal domain-containing protein [Brachybacterium sillae]